MLPAVPRRIRYVGDGRAAWPALRASVLGSPFLLTGLALLLDLQDPYATATTPTAASRGGWPEATVCSSCTTPGVRSDWRTAAQPTAFAVEALARARLARRDAAPRRHECGRDLRKGRLDG